MTSYEHILSEKILLPVGKTSVCGFLACKGKLYDGGLMVVGRAVNGWKKRISFKNIASEEKRRYFAKVVADDAQGGECPMHWVLDDWGSTEGYNTKRSAFWRVIKQVAINDEVCAGASEDDWASHLVWSNLYKVAPSEGGNPTGKQMEAQREGCKKLLRREIEDFAPSRLLFLTGLEWAEPFLQAAVASGGGDVTHAKGTHVVATGRLGSRKGRSCATVVANHPQGKRECNWVKEVLAAFKALGAN